MEKRKLNFRPWVISLLVTFLLVLASPVGKSYSGDVDPADKQAFFDALVDTEKATQREISTKLLAVVPWYDTLNDTRLHGSSLKWENPNDPSNSRILVETLLDKWAYDNFYREHIGEEGYLLTRNLWVTVVPEMKNFFIGKKTCPPSLKRIVQLKGLNPARLVKDDPDDNYRIIVEMWVYPKDLFRPTPDPEITDHEGELSVKIDGNWTFPSDFNAFLALIEKKDSDENDIYNPASLKDWFAKNVNYKRTGPISEWGSAWTRLGYTYDWGNPDDHVGLSEFIILLKVAENGLKVKLERAIDSANTEEWNNYFRCAAEGTGGSGGGGCFTKTCD